MEIWSICDESYYNILPLFSECVAGGRGGGWRAERRHETNRFPVFISMSRTWMNRYMNGSFGARDDKICAHAE